MKKLLKLLVVFALLLSMVLSSVGCQNSKEEQNTNGGGNEVTTDVESAEFGGSNFNVQYSYPQGTHSFKVKTDNNRKVISNGLTEYKIVVSKNATKFDEIAVAEFNEFFEESTGLKLNVLEDDGISFDATSKYICIGNVDFLKTAGITIPNNLGLSGYILKTYGNSIFIAGGQYAPVYGVYEYLKWALGYEYFIDDCYTIKKGVTELYFIDFDIVDVPDIESRGKGYGNVNSKEMQMRMRYSYESVLASVNSNTHHTTFNYINPDEYRSTHPEYFSEKGEQLSYTANGNATALLEMQDIVFEKLKEIAINFPTVSAVEFTQQDVSDWSNYDLDTYRPTYGVAAAAASQIIFINPVAKRFQEWLDEAFPGRQFTIVLFAYWTTVEAPVKLENGKYVPIDDKVKLEDNVGVFYAPIEMDFTREPDDLLNVNVKNNFKKWSSICKKLYFWSYSVYFGNYFIPYYNLDVVQPLYQFALENNVCFIFDEGAYGDGPTSAWNSLKAYIDVQLMWNSHYNLEKLYRKFFENMYGPASDKMYEIFDQMRIWYQVCRTMDVPIGGTSSCLSSDQVSTKYWKKAVLENWISMYGDAFDKIEKYKTTDRKTYEKYYKRIALEYTSPRYLLLYFYGESLSKTVHDELLNGLCYDIEQLGIIQLAEAVETSGLRDSL